MFKRRRPLARAQVIMIICLIGIVLLGLVDLSLRKVFYNIAEVKAIQLATESVYGALRQEIDSEDLKYEDFITVHKDSEGRVAMMQANTIKVSRVAAGMTMSIQSSLEELKNQSFSIPFGQVFGIPLLANYGPRISYHIAPAGTVRVNIIDRFEAAGINQTRHIIYLGFDTNVRIVIPYRSGEAVVATQVPIAESIVVGSVPGTYVNLPGGIFGSGLVK